MTNKQKNFYLDKFGGKIFVLKIGGEVVESKKILENILKDIKDLFGLGIRIILVHGGGNQADNISKQLGHTPQKINGRRITTAKDLEVVKMLYGGTMNLEILSLMKKLKMKGLRVSGLDGNLLHVKIRPKKEIDYGFVGDIHGIDTEILFLLLDKGYLPVVSPLAVTSNGTILNINADTIAIELAIKLKAEKLILFTNIDGIYQENQLLSVIDTKEAKSLIVNDVVTGGMRVKIESCIKAIKKGIKRVHILNGLSTHSLLKEVLSTTGIGTMITSEKEKKIYFKEQS